jgi:uncharacterized membrane protein YgcG
MALPPTQYAERWAGFQALMIGLPHGGAKAQELKPQFDALVKPLQHLEHVLRTYPLPDYGRALLLADHAQQYWRLRALRLHYMNGIGAAMALKANRATGEEKEDQMAIQAAGTFSSRGGRSGGKTTSRSTKPVGGGGGNGGGSGSSNINVASSRKWGTGRRFAAAAQVEVR